MVSSLPMGTERRLGELGEDDFSKFSTFSRSWKVEQERPRSSAEHDRPVLGRFQRVWLQLCVEHGARALFQLWQHYVLPNWHYQLNTSGLRD